MKYIEMVVATSAPKYAIDVPIYERNGIKQRFKTKSTTAPIPQHKVTILILPLGNNTCMPKTLDMATINMIGAIIWDGNIEFSNFAPHKAVIKLGAQNIKPMVIGKAIASVKSYDF